MITPKDASHFRDAILCNLHNIFRYINSKVFL